MCLSALPADVVYLLASFTEDDSALLGVNREIMNVTKPWFERRRAFQTAALSVATCQLVKENSVYALYFRRLSHGIYRCRDPAADYDHLFIRLDTYQSFIRESGALEQGLFVPGLVYTPEEATRGMISFDRFLN